MHSKTAISSEGNDCQENTLPFILPPTVTPKSAHDLSIANFKKTLFKPVIAMSRRDANGIPAKRRLRSLRTILEEMTVEVVEVDLPMTANPSHGGTHFSNITSLCVAKPKNQTLSSLQSTPLVPFSHRQQHSSAGVSFNAEPLHKKLN